jgi:transcriptional regulator with XRE-family HTH domain
MASKPDRRHPGNGSRLASTTSIRQIPLPPGDDIGAAELGRRVAANLRERRRTRNLSLDQLAIASGVSRAALSQIETQRSNPSLGVLWKIAVGLSIPFAELIGGDTQSIVVLRRNESQVLRTSDGKMESRPLTPAGASPWVEAYELQLLAHGIHSADAHAAGTREVVVVLAGQLRMRVGASTYDLESGDSISFQADQPHAYENSSNTDLRCHDVIIYSR